MGSQAEPEPRASLKYQDLTGHQAPETLLLFEQVLLTQLLP